VEKRSALAGWKLGNPKPGQHAQQNALVLRQLQASLLSHADHWRHYF